MTEDKHKYFNFEKLIKFGLGLRTKTVVLEQYNPDWELAFQFMKAKIEEVLQAPRNYKIEHFGSTSVPGLAAKPILDILIIFDDKTKFEHDIKNLEKFGFEYKHDAIARVENTEPMLDRHFFSLPNQDKTINYVYLHAVASYHKDYIDRQLAFRDVLRKDPQIMYQYAQLKYGLLNEELRNPTGSRRVYTNSKSPFIAAILKQQGK